MKTVLFLISLSWMTLVCPAAEIVGWQIPLTWFVGNGLETRGIVRCENAPESSPFFKEGDELWDLKNVTSDLEMEANLSLDWLVWDATSARLVAKGDWADLCAIHELLRPDQQAKQCRLTMNLYPVPANLVPPGAGLKPVGTISVLTRSAQPASAGWKEAETSMKVEAEVTIGEDGRIANIRIDCSAQLSNQPRMEVDTAVELRSGKRFWIARDFDGQQGLDLELIPVIETMGGVPIEEQVMIQHGDALDSLMPESKPAKRCRAGEGWLLVCDAEPLSIMAIISPGSQTPDADPFAEPAPRKPETLPRASSVKPPEFLSDWLKHDVLDARELIGSIVPGIKGSANFAGYDPISECLYFYSTDERLLDMVEVVFTATCYLSPATVITTLGGIGQTRLVSKSGQKARLSRTMGEKEIKRLLEIEPTIGENGDLLDMRLRFEDEMNPERTTRINTATVLSAGKDKELFSSSGNGSETKLSLNADVQRIPPD